MDESMRLDKMLGQMGIGTRSGIRKMARQGRITVNGAVIRDSGVRVRPQRDEIEVDGRPFRYRKHVYVMLHKPQGVVSATEDMRERTVLDLIDPALLVFRPFPVGRLDKDAEGLLLLTDDGKLAHDLLSPRKGVPKMYRVEVDGAAAVGDGVKRRFERGVELDDGHVTMPASLEVLQIDAANGNGVRTIAELTIHEGKFHQVKRMFAAVGMRVVHLKRIRMGPLRLDSDLSPGESRELTEEELAALKEATQGGQQ